MQILVDVFDVKGIVHYGIAKSSNDSLSLGDVSVPNYVAFTSSWKWKVISLFYLSQRITKRFVGFIFSTLI